MLLYYIRHGDPSYVPDELTNLGKQQASALAKRLASHGIDQVFTSTSGRAIETAQPLCDLLKLNPTLLDWCNEEKLLRLLHGYTGQGYMEWIFRVPEIRRMFCSDEVRKLGRQWYTHPFFDGTNYGVGIQKVQADVDAFLEHLGYRHDLENNVYEAVAPNDQRVALFAHEGVGAAVLSCILDIPYPIFTTHFDMTHTGVTVIEFAENYGVLTPRVLSYDNDSHIYREGLPTRFQNKFYF